LDTVNVAALLERYSDSMAVHGRRRIDEIGDESRRRILDATEELFAEKGFERTSFVDIAERSGISRGSIPWHFKNKDGLLMAVVERQIGRSLPTDLESGAIPSIHGLVERLVALIKAPGPNLFYMVLTEAMTTEGVVHDQYVEFFRDLRAGVVEWILVSQPDRTTAHAEALGVVIHAAALGIQLQWRLDPAGVDLEQSLQSLALLVETVIASSNSSSLTPRRRRP
jgi:TetR/AcrR family acrAB operon transcriptional repressor